MNDLLAPVRAVVNAHKAKLHSTETVISLNGCYDMPVVIEYDSGPAEARTYGYPGYPGFVDIVRVMANGIDIRNALPAEFLKALEQDIREGGL